MWLEQVRLLAIAILIVVPSCSFAQAHPSLDKKIGQMIMIGFHGQSFNDKELREAKQQIKNGEIGGLIFLAYNISTESQTKLLIKDLTSLQTLQPLLIAVDEEGGKIERLSPAKGFKHFPPAAEIPQQKNTTGQTLSLYRQMGIMLKDFGFNLNLAPVVDLNINPTSPAIGLLDRSYSADPATVAKYAKAFILGHRQSYVLTCLKHYPGHGSAAEDSHLGLTDVTKTWTDKELIPYKHLINAGLPDCIMSAHIFNSKVDNKYPASLSTNHIQKTLRDKLGFDGVVITDDLQMGAISKSFSLDEAVIQAVNSGNDILLFANFFTFDKELPWKINKIIKQAIRDQKIKEARIDESYQRILALKKTI